MFATRSGGTTIDQDAFGGNPFATALIELAAADRITLDKLPGRLRALTVKASRGHQAPEWTSWPQRLKWSFQLRAGSRQERRCALVLIVSDYTGAGLIPLTGAACDERRISMMLAANGFSVVQGTGSVYLLPGDYPLAHGCSPSQLQAKAVPVDRIAAACGASRLNLVFFAGCRTLAVKNRG